MEAAAESRTAGDVVEFQTGSLATYDIIEKVGQGAFGEVFKAVRKGTDGHLVALKKVRLDYGRCTDTNPRHPEMEGDGFPITGLREIKILRQLRHPNVVRLEGVAPDIADPDDQTRVKGAFYMVFEYMEHDLVGLLAQQDVVITVDNVRDLTRGLLQGVGFCHARGMLHRDIKASNLLLNKNGVLKLADFGLARRYETDSERAYTNKVITMGYRPPELLLGNEHYGPEVDIWSCGCILGELFTRTPIFPGTSELEVLGEISVICGSPNTKDWPALTACPHFGLFDKSLLKTSYPRMIDQHFGGRFGCPADAVDLLDKLLTLDPSRRIGGDAALRHPFFKPELCKPLLIQRHIRDSHELAFRDRRKEQAELGRKRANAAGTGHGLED